MNKNLVMLITSILIISCGGGGGGGAPADDSSSPSPSSISGVQLNGTASKGILNGGVVIAEELDESANVIATLGTTTTAADGSYSLTLNDDYAGGIIQITVSVNADTQMKCDVPAGCGWRADNIPDTDYAIDFGEWYKPVALTMTALVPDAAANATVNVNVTPFTHMAAVRARTSATLDFTAIATANSEVSNLLGGINILNTAPVDITDATAIGNAASEVQVTYAALASALSNQGLFDFLGQPDLDGAIALLADSFTTGLIRGDDDGDDYDDAQLSMQEILTATDATLLKMGVSDVTGILDGMQSDIDDAGADGFINPGSSPTAADPALVKVKAMMSDVRTWANIIEEETRAKRTVFDSQIRLAADAINIGTDDLGKAFHASIDAAFNFNGNDVLADYELDTVSFTAGTIVSPETGLIEITGGDIYGYTVNMTIRLPEDGTSGSSFNLGIVSADITSLENSLTINTGLANIVFASDYTFDYAALEQGTAVPLPLTNPVDLTFDLDVEFTQLVDSSGSVLVSPVSFAGTMFFDLDVIPVINNPERLAALPNRFELSGEINNTQGDSLTASLVINVNNTATFEFAEDPVDGGSLTETASNWIDADIGLTFVAQLSGLPEARINITADRTGFEAGNGSITISYGDRQIIISGSTTNMNDIEGVVTITNQDSVVLEFYAEDEEQPLNGTLSYNGIEYATVSETDRGYLKVSYVDGTFEIF